MVRRQVSQFGQSSRIKCPMPLYRMMSSLQDTDNLSEDRFVNTIYVHSAVVADTAAFTALTTAYRNFWQAAHAPSVIPLSDFMSSTAHGAGSVVKIYDMADPTPRPVKHDQVFTLAGSALGTWQLPAEVAVCLSFKAAPVAGVNPQSLRGRIYLGPLADYALNQAGDDAHSRPRPSLITAMLDAAVALKTQLADAGGQWVIASRKRQEYHEVVEVSVDNAWDTQRRRGHAPTVRTVRGVAVAGGGGSSGSF
jgi:hypothetical protein